MTDHMRHAVKNLWMTDIREWEAIVPYGDGLISGIDEAMPLLGWYDETPVLPTEPSISVPSDEVVDDVSQGARDHSKHGCGSPRPMQMI